MGKLVKNYSVENYIIIQTNDEVIIFDNLCSQNVLTRGFLEKLIKLTHNYWIFKKINLKKKPHAQWIYFYYNVLTFILIYKNNNNIRCYGHTHLYIIPTPDGFNKVTPLFEWGHAQSIEMGIEHEWSD